jgi:hypothetical protein
LFGIEHIDIEWLSDAAMTAMGVMVWSLAVVGFLAALATRYHALRIALGAL